MATTINVRFKVRGRTAADWTTGNEVLLERELGLETDTRKFKFGDGVTAWNALAYAAEGAVTSVAGKTGVVTLVKGDVGLGNVDNTSDANKPVSTAQQTALNLKANSSALGTAAAQNIGTSGANVPLLNGANVWSAGNQFLNIGAGVVAVAGLPIYGRKSSGTVIYADDGVSQGFAVNLGGGRTQIGNDFGSPFSLMAGNAEHVRIQPGGAVAFLNVGTTASAANAYLDAGSSPANSLMRSTSSARYKAAFEPIEMEAADRMLGLQAVWYRSLAEADRKDWSWYGYTAEEVAAIDPRCVTWIPEVTGWKKVKRPVDVVVRPKRGRAYLRRTTVTEREPILSGRLIPDGVMYDRVSLLREAALLRRIEKLEALVADLVDAKA